MELDPLVGMGTRYIEVVFMRKVHVARTKEVLRSILLHDTGNFVFNLVTEASAHPE